MSENNREAELIADIEALTADRDQAVRERNKFLLQRDELLDALEWSLRQMPEPVLSGEYTDGYRKARAAIAKATGAA